MDPTFLQGHAADLEINDFLNRKVKIATYNYNTAGVIIAQTIDPWSAYFNNAAIKRKIENYAFLNCKLELEFRINAAPSFFGCFMVSYEPLKDWRPALPIPSQDAPSAVCYSQRPHIYLSLETNTGGTMKLPFLYHKNWLTLSSTFELTNMGRITIFPMTSMDTTNGDIGNFDISVYARAVDVKLSNTTQVPVLQSSVAKVPSKVRKKRNKSSAGSAPDEFEQAGPISGPASAVADVAAQMATVPFLAPYARATEMVANGIGSMAKLFGFAKTPVLDEPSFIRNTAFGAMADAVTSETVDRLVLDSKQGTIIDSRTAGLDGADEMAIASIAQREAFLKNFKWSEGDVANTVLFELDVVPNLQRVNGTTSYLTPMAYASLPFKYWRGSINFRFRVVASQYHRGRYQVQWDPRGLRSTIDPLRIEEITTTTVDLATDRDVTISIPFAQDRSYLPLNKDITLENFGTNPVSLGHANGTVSISVVNELNTFGSTDPITIMVFVSMGDDVEFQGPMDLPTNVQLSSPNVVAQSAEVNMSDTRQAGDGAPVGGAVTVNQTEVTEAPDHTSAIFFGERIYSFRSMLKRYNINYSLTYFGEADINNRYTKLLSILPRYPIARGQDNLGMSSQGNGRTNYANLVLFRYITSAFVGMRGGMRWKVNFCGNSLASDVQVHRSQELRFTSNLNEVTSNPSTEGLATYMQNFVADGRSSAGYALTNQHTQAGVIVELPYYQDIRFQSTNPKNTYKGYSYDNSDVDSMALRVNLFGSAAPKNQAATFHCATGEDFNVFFFLNTPPLYSYVNE